ncbi:unnamed protein product, partial [Choristocarpus tenellus]
MPSISGFIQSLLAEDMYATGMIEKLDERIQELNSGQLKLLVRFCKRKIPGLTNKTIVDAYSKLLKKATVETERRHEDEVREERDRLRQLKAAHAGVNAKAWDTSHAELDRELAIFQHFLKAKARRVAEEEVMGEEMERLHDQLMALPERRVAADKKKALWSLTGAVFIITGVGLAFLPVALAAAISIAVLTCCTGICSIGLGQLQGRVVTPCSDEKLIKAATRAKAKTLLRVYREEVKRNYEEFERAFAEDMKWRDNWVKACRQEKKERLCTAQNKKMQQTHKSRVAPSSSPSSVD